MFDFYQKRKMRTVINSPVTRIGLLILVIALVWSAYTRFQIASDMQERRVEAESEVQKLRDQKQQLEEKVHYLSDERGIEAEMRRQFDVALPDEQVVVIVESENNVAPLATSTPNKDESPWYKFWQ